VGYFSKYRVSKAHADAVKASSARIFELNQRDKVSIPALAIRFDCSAETIRNIIRKEKKKRLPPATV
jgi:hypothetical protein